MMGMALQTIQPRSRVPSFKQPPRILINRHSSGHGVLMRLALKSDWITIGPQFASHYSTGLFSVKKTGSLWQLLRREGRLQNLQQDRRTIVLTFRSLSITFSTRAVEVFRFTTITVIWLCLRMELVTSSEITSIVLLFTGAIQ